MKQKMVTRTVKLNRVELLMLNTATNETFSKTFEIPRTPNEKKNLEMAGKLAGDGFKALTILSVEPFVKMFGMTESTFITLASELDENRRVIPSEKILGNE